MNGYENHHFQCRGKLDDIPPDPSDPGCQKTGKCKEYTVMSAPGDFLIIHLQVTRLTTNETGGWVQ